MNSSFIIPKCIDTPYNRSDKLESHIIKREGFGISCLCIMPKFFVIVISAELYIQVLRFTIDARK